MTGTYTGLSLPRREDAELLQGAGTYVGDVRLPGTLHAAFYRSPYAHARLLDLDVEAARRLPGVALVLTAADLHERVTRMEPFPFQSRDPFLRGNPRIKFHDRYGLAEGKVRFAGEPVALVVAVSRYVAEDAVELIEADYEPLPCVLDAEDALEPGAPLLYEDWGDNEALEFHVSGGDVDRAFAEAEVVVEERVQHHRFTGTPLEPRGLLAAYDGDANRLTVWDSTQIPHVVAALLEDSIRQPAGVEVRLVAPHVGGGFGQKWGFYPEELVVPVASTICGRPVRWIETRREHMVATNHAREQTHRVALAFRRDGRLLGIKDVIHADLGDAYPVGGFAAIVTTAMYVPGAYDVQDYDCRLHGVVTNKTPFGAHRGFGKAECAYVIERMMDVAAERLGMDPAELRLRNVIQPEQFPYVSATGSRYDSGDYPRALRRALELAGYEDVRAEQVRRSHERRRLGVGMALVIEPSSSTRMGSYNSGYYSTRVTMDTSGRVHVATGGNDEGQGHLTTISQLVADELGVTPEQVSATEGDTLHTPYGSGSYSSRFSIVGTSSVTLAARDLGSKIKRIAAHRLEVDEADVELAEGSARVRGAPSRGMTLRELARVAYHRIHDLPDGEEPGLQLTHHYRDPNIAFDTDARGRVAMFSSFPYCVDVAVVEVDPDTGEVVIRTYVSVHDCGNLLNPRIVEGQHVGALAHGFGGALMETLTYDDNGQLRNGSFKDYFVPTVMEIPRLTLDHVVTPNPFTPGGFKGAGETGTVSPVPCLANAVEDALRPLGVRIRRLPLSPHLIWEQVREARAAGRG